MAPRPDPSEFAIVERSGPAGRLVMQRTTADGRQLIVIAGYAGPQLPASMHGLVLELAGTIAQPDTWRLTAAEGVFEFRARAVETVDECPALYEPLHRRFALRSADRIAVRVLLWLLRLPGGARLMRRWHAGRST